METGRDGDSNNNMYSASKEHCWDDISMKVSGKDYTDLVKQWQVERETHGTAAYKNNCRRLLHHRLLRPRWRPVQWRW